MFSQPELTIPRHAASIWPVCSLLALLAAPAAALPLDQAVLDEINYARTQPQAYLEVLRAYRSSYQGKVVEDPLEPGYHVSEEGVAAVDEAIRILAAQRPLPPLAPGSVLALAAADHAAAQARRGDVGHVSTDGLNPSQRVARRGGGLYVSETIAYGFDNPVAIVRQLIVDDGVADRGHRNVIFSGALRFAGASCGPHPVYTTMCVVDYSSTVDGRVGMVATVVASGDR